MAIDYSSLPSFFDAAKAQIPSTTMDDTEGFFSKNPRAAISNLGGRGLLPNYGKRNWRESLSRILPDLFTEFEQFPDPSLSFSAFLALADPMQRVHDLGPRGRGERPMNYAPRTRTVRRG